MKKIIAGILLLTCCAGCNFVKVNKNVADEIRAMIDSVGMNISVADENTVLLEPTVEQFSRIVCNVPAELEISQGGSSVSLQTPERLITKIEVTCTGGVITISSKEKNFRNWNDVEVHICTPDLESLAVNGAAEVEINPFKTESLALLVNGVADMDIKNIDCGNLSVEIKGTGEVEISGRADRAYLEISGVGDIDIDHFDCPTIKRSIKGVGVIR